MPKRRNTSDDEDSPSSENDSTDAESSSAAEAAKTASKKAKSRAAKLTAPPQKKAKSSSHPGWISQPPTAANGEKVLTNSEGDKYIDLGKKKRATVRSFKGVTLLDIREYYGAEGDEKPGKKGISLTLEQWNLLREGSSNIDKLLSQKKQATMPSS